MAGAAAGHLQRPVAGLWLGQHLLLLIVPSFARTKSFLLSLRQVLPLGTGNDLSLTFGWGNTFLPAWLRSFASVYHLLRRIADAQPRELDCWRISITAGPAAFCVLHHLYQSGLKLLGTPFEAPLGGVECLLHHCSDSK